ncbi:MAG: hypothetical protein H6861_06220 [Rhodospirillales bacterium]|nr:hypothetical protein [Rhodospirillales bacterium]
MTNDTTPIRKKAADAALYGHYAEAVMIMAEGIAEQNRTFDDWLELVKYLSLSRAWLQADCVAETAFNKINTPKQRRRFNELQERFKPPKLTNLIRGSQFGGTSPPKKEPVDDHKHSP